RRGLVFPLLLWWGWRRRMTGPLGGVVGASRPAPAEPRYGYDLMKAARLPSGTLYPLLARLERENLVASAWETPQQEGERPRKYYQLTGEGIRIARLELAQASARRQRAPARTGRPAPRSLGSAPTARRCRCARTCPA